MLMCILLVMKPIAVHTTVVSFGSACGKYSEALQMYDRVLELIGQVGSLHLRT